MEKYTFNNLSVNNNISFLCDSLDSNCNFFSFKTYHRHTVHTDISSDIWVNWVSKKKVFHLHNRLKVNQASSASRCLMDIWSDASTTWRKDMLVLTLKKKREEVAPVTYLSFDINGHNKHLVDVEIKLYCLVSEIKEEWVLKVFVKNPNWRSAY